MKIAEIDWPLFWHALGQQDFINRGLWLRRWIFADDGVRLSMRPEGGRTTGGDPASIADASLDRTASTKAEDQAKLDAATGERGLYAIGKRMGFRSCQLCRKEINPVYRAHGGALDLKVCGRCASSAWAAGFTIESLDSMALKKSSRAFMGGAHGHRRLIRLGHRRRAAMT